MPSSDTALSATKRRGSVVRQLSLQGQAPPQTSGPRRGIKKQLSEDNTICQTGSVGEITGQGWGLDKTAVKTNDGTRTSQNKTCNIGLKQRPVKLAWSDRRHGSLDSPGAGVEIVARKCQGQPRPVTAKPQRITNLPLLGDKDTLLYTRQQLTERLRKAWKEREKNRPNLDIFLAQNSGTPDDSLSSNRVSEDQRSDNYLDTTGTDTQRSHSPTSGRRRVTQEPVKATVPTKLTKQIKFTEDKSDVGQKKAHTSISQNNIFKHSISKENKHSIEINFMNDDQIVNNPALSDILNFQTFPFDDLKPVKSNSESILSLKPWNSVNKKVGDSILKKENSLNNNKENSYKTGVSFAEDIYLSPSTRSDSKEEDLEQEKDEEEDVSVKMEDVPKPTTMTASARRASFKASSLLNKTIASSFSDPVNCEFDDEKNENSDFKSYNNVPRPQLLRTSSAPSQRSEDELIVQEKMTKTIQPRKPLTLAASIDLNMNDDEDSLSLKDRSKTSSRRKIKTTTSRKKYKDKGNSSDDERENKEVEQKKNTSRRRPIIKNGGDIITMVSLVSPATSDTEEPGIPILTETWTDDNKEESVLSQINTRSSSSDEVKEGMGFIIPKFVSLRKTNKTVSFQSHPPVNRSYSANFPVKRAPAGASIIIPTPAQVVNEDKRSNQPVGTQVVPDSRGIKRRLIRTRSAPAQEDEILTRDEDIVKTEAQVPQTNNYTSTRTENSEAIQFEESETAVETDDECDLNREPEFKTPKERECWTLYRKMLEKGVSVSYDTVLRGMLTPTEYRLRKNELLSGC